MKLSVSASRGGNAKTVLSFAFGVEGSAGGTPCPHASALRLRGTGKAAKTSQKLTQFLGDFRQPGTPELSHNLVPVCYPALAFLTVKTAEKVNPDLLFALRNACRQRRKKAVMRPPSRCQSVVRGSVRRYRRQCQTKLRTCRSGQPRRRGQSESCFHSGPSARRRQCSILTGDAR